jgi:plastocyanin
MGSIRTIRRLTVAAVAAAVLACGGGDNGGGGSPISPSGGGPGPSGATITIANGSISPAQVSIATGQSVTFINNDTRPREMASDPHPTHGNCPAINATGTLAAGQTRLTNSFGGVGTCGFHDHADPDNAALKGTITIR